MSTARKRFRTSDGRGHQPMDMILDVEGTDIASKWNELPEVVLDIIFGRNLAAEDIRSCHQVCKNWNKAVESRQKVNDKRKELVIRTYKDKENKEQNMILDFRTHSNKSTEGKSSDVKIDSYNSICRNVLCSSASSNASSTRSGQATPKTSSNRSTPKSRFQIQSEAARKLKDGEVLSPCPECQSPVPSPSPCQQPRTYRIIGVGISDLEEEQETESIETNNNRAIQHWQSECPACSYRFCSHCKWKEHPGKPCREIDGESAYINDCDRLRNSKSSNLRNCKVLSRRKKNLALRRIANL